ncbi:MAG: hypothetical protein GQ574_19445 [Crocinitomix sp.]|nr:hypothetical protein [Crocinitomix sp.]
MTKIILSCIAAVLLISCNKTEGPGGTSSITGFVKSQNHQSAQVEISEVLFSQGLSVEHGDYWVLNNPIGAEQFYIYYDNPTWPSESNPSLAGRTGIEVSFNYSDSNVEIAANTMAEIETEASDHYTLSRNVDIVYITNKAVGETANADKVTSPFEISTTQSGKSELLESIQPAVDEKVYLVYGENEVFGELERTGGNGEYIFNNLTDGNYTVYCASKDISTGSTITVSNSVTITDKKTIVTADEIQIYN